MTESIYGTTEKNIHAVFLKTNTPFVTFGAKHLLQSCKITTHRPETDAVGLYALCARDPSLDEYAVMGSLAPS